MKNSDQEITMEGILKITSNKMNNICNIFKQNPYKYKYFYKLFVQDKFYGSSFITNALKDNYSKEDFNQIKNDLYIILSFRDGTHPIIEEYHKTNNSTDTVSTYLKIEETISQCFETYDLVSEETNLIGEI